MDWLRTRYETAIEAFTARRTLVIGFIFALATAAYHLSAKVTSEWLSILLNAPGWAWGLIVALLVALWFIFEYAHRKRMQTVSKLTLSFNPDCIVQTPTKIQRIDQDKLVQTDSNGIYVCLKRGVRNVVGI
jgi:hypothetical protein